MKDSHPTYADTLAQLSKDVAQLELDGKGSITRMLEETPTLPMDALPVLHFEDIPTQIADVRLGELLGEGGMGRVLAAQQVSLRREVAVKILKGDEASAAGALLREALLTGRLEHPGIVPVHLLGRTAEGSPVFVMRRIEGIAWITAIQDPSVVRKLQRSEQQPSPEFAVLDFHLNVLQRVCSAVAFAHARGVLHRDLKPDNVMLGTYDEVYVVDWGLGVSLQKDPILPLAEEQQSIVGTPAYMPPEMAVGAGAALSVRTDVFLLGAILHEILTGAPPYRGSTVLELLDRAYEAAPASYSSSVPEELAAICKRAMHREPAQRFASVEHFSAAIEDYRRHRGSNALARAAELRAQQLREHTERFPSAEAEQLAAAAALYRLFTECRFGFREALAAWPENSQAQAGLQSALEVMMEHELRCKNLHAAQTLFAEMQAPSEALRKKLQQLEKAIDEEKQHKKQLEHFRHDADPNVAASDRARYSAFAAVFWFFVALGVAWAEQSGYWVFRLRDATLTTVLFTLTNAWIIWSIERSSAINLAHRRLTYAAMVGNLAMTSHWFFCLFLQTPMRDALSLFLLLVSSGWCLTAMLIDRRVLLTGISFLVAAVAVALLPAYKFVWLGFAILLGMGWLAWSWRDSEPVLEGKRLVMKQD